MTLEMLWGEFIILRVKCTLFRITGYGYCWSQVVVFNTVINVTM
jgi:hypothetical protein